MATRPTSDPSRAGAVWVTATGASLLVAAAAVFVAVRWDQVPDAARLAILLAGTGAALLAGRGLRGALPATSGVLRHLGAFLVPVDAAAVATHLGVGWRGQLVVVGLVATATFTGLGRVEPSPVLRWAAVAAVAVTAAGVGATTIVPAAVALAAVAVLAVALGWHRPALAWALAAGLAPALALVGPALHDPAGAVELGLADLDPHRLALASGVAAAGVIAAEARRRSDPALLVAAGVSVALGAASAYLDLRPSGPVLLVSAGLAFLVVELATHAVRADPFWGPPTRALAEAAEVVAAASAGVAAVVGVVAVWPPVEGLSPRLAGDVVVTAALATGAWLVADLRRRPPDTASAATALLVGPGTARTTTAMVATVLAGVALGTGSAVALALAMVVGAAVLVVSGRVAAHALAAVLAVAAPLEAATTPGLALACGAAGGLAVAGAAVVRAGMVHPVGRYQADAELPWLLGVAAIAPVATAGLVALVALEPTVVLAAAVTSCWAIALVLDLGGRHPSAALLGLVGRAGALATVVVMAALVSDAHPSGLVSPSTTALAAAVVGLAALADAVRRRQPPLALVAAVASPVAVAAGSVQLGLGGPGVGVALCVAAAVGTAVVLVVDRRWLPAAGVGAALAGGVGLGLAAHDDLAFSASALLVGTCLLAVAARWWWWHLAAVGAAVATIGIWGFLATGGVEPTDAYLVPVAACLVVAGLLARRGGHADRTTSWVAYGPAIALLGGSALAERALGGAGVHALVAGAVGMGAVAIGGWARLAAPLVLGTALLAALTVVETISLTAGVPTWAWLATAGAALVALGITLERTTTGPLEGSRRLVDTIRERFT